MDKIRESELKTLFRFGVYNSFVIITNFDKLSSLNFKSCSSKFNFTTFSLKPSTPLILNDSLDLDGLVIQPIKIVIYMLHNFKGFDLTSNPFKNVKFKSNTLVMWSIQYFYLQMFWGDVFGELGKIINFGVKSRLAYCILMFN